MLNLLLMLWFMYINVAGTVTAKGLYGGLCVASHSRIGASVTTEQRLK